jgi:hypothetical protein
MTPGILPFLRNCLPEMDPRFSARNECFTGKSSFQDMLSFAFVIIA